MGLTLEDLNYVPEMPENVKNIVIIGAGGIVTGSHLPAYKMAGYPVKGIYDLNYDKAKQAAADFDILNAVEKLEDLIALGVKEDAVFDIAVPARRFSCRSPWARALSRHGRFWTSATRRT